MRDRLPIFIALLILFGANPVSAQNIKWNTAPQRGFVFQITNNEAQKLLTKSSSDTIINSLLHTRIDTFNVSKGWTRRPDKGHFILATINENKLHCEYTSVFPYQVLLLKEYNALSLQVLDLEGNVREDAKVKFRTRRIRFDAESNTYRIENEWFNVSTKIVTVELDGFRSVFNIEKHDVPSWSNDYYKPHDGPDFYSYMITDKNKYKPGERVRFKSYALSGSRNPLRRSLEVWLTINGRPKQIGMFSPHRPGSFVGEFQLHDSLKLTLDKHYSLELWDKSGRIAARCTFKYEDYELHSNRLHVELETPRHFSPASNAVKIIATNENGLVLKDAHAVVTVLTENIREVFQPLVILPDTLMFKEITLSADDTTVVEIPSSWFQKSNTSYYVHVAVLNSQNQRMERSLSASHYYSQYELTATFSNDSIVYQMLNNGTAMHNVSIKMFRDSETEGTDIILPYKEKINPATAVVHLKSELASRSFQMNAMLPKIKFIGGIQRDSFNISIENPQKIQVSWYIYQGSLLLEKGSGTEIDFKSGIEDRTETFYAELLYSFAGSDHIITRAFPFREGSLDIALNLPDKVYPGQKVDASIEVTDDLGNAVSGVDLTAFATTARLNYNLPDLPYYGSTSYARSEKATYTKSDVNKRKAILKLDYKKWASVARLDTMKYYQWTYPGEKTFLHTVRIGDSTQFAPFVMKGGMAKNIYVIEVDRVPVYYSWTNQPKGYSFYVQPGKKKSITLRLFDRVLLLDSMTFERGKKTILSIDLDHLPPGVSTHEIDPQIERISRRRKLVKHVLTLTEVSRHRYYLAAFKGTRSAAYLTYFNEFVAVSQGGNEGETVVVGPILRGSQTFSEERGTFISYIHENGFTYSFAGNVVYKLEPPKHLLPQQLTNESFRPITLINQVAVNKTLLLQREPYVPNKWHPGVIDLVDYSCRLKLLLPDEKARSGVSSVLFQNTETGEVESPCRSYSGRSDFFAVPRGVRHIIVLYNNGSFLKIENIDLRSHTNIVADMNAQQLHSADSASAVWLTLSGNCYGSASKPPRTFVLQTMHNAIGNIRGSVIDFTSMGLPGVNVVVKGTAIGTVTDANGNFMLDIPEDPSTIVVSFIGMKSEEVEVRSGSEITIVMQEDVTQLSEVVVVGYGEQTRREMTGAISTLSGRVAGVTITSADNSDEGEEPQSETEKQNREAEQRLYEELLTLTTIRSKFSDVGFWEPRLFTDRHGRSKFTVTFPDDITRWDAVVFAMNPRLQTGTVRKSIRSYKPLMAELHVPQFLTVGDTADFMGKVLNYTSDKTIHGKTKWTASAPRENPLTFDSYHTEKFAVAATSADTILTSFSFTRDDGYFDGEERKVSVVGQGTLRANGKVDVLKNNEEVRLQAKKGSVMNIEIMDNPIALYAETCDTFSTTATIAMNNLLPS
jgi:alpha-2-macroglobulin